MKRDMLILVIVLSVVFIGFSGISVAGTVATNEVASAEKQPFPETGPLVDCALFPTVNTVATLMSWSNHYHKKIIAAGNNQRRAAAACNDTIDYRGMAHCKAPRNQEVRQALLDTLTRCRAIGIEWQEIEHSEIFTKK